MLPCRYIAGYVGVGNFSHQQIEEVATTLTPKEARKLLKDTFIVQEYVPGGSLKDMVLAQVSRVQYPQQLKPQVTLFGP